MEHRQSAALKASVEEIRATFERAEAVEHYSNLNTGQQTALDSALMMEVLTLAAIRTTPHARDVLDIGCGAGNYTLKLLEYSAGLNCTMLDISRAMLDRAQERVRQQRGGRVQLLHGDIRDIELGREHFDLVMSGTALHHLRSDREWEVVFRKIFCSLRSGGSFWISDFISHEHPVIQECMFARYGNYLEIHGGPAFREKAFSIIDREDSPRSVEYQMQLLQKIGFVKVTILHKHACFAAFGGMKVS